MGKCSPSRRKRVPIPPWLSCSGVLALVPLLGCSDLVEPSDGLVPAFISGFEVDDPQLTLSAAGLSVSFEIATYGNSCRSKGETEIVQAVADHKLALSPLDRISSEAVCLDFLQVFHHSGSVTLSEPGIWTVVLSGEESSGKSVEFEFVLEVGF